MLELPARPPAPPPITIKSWSATPPKARERLTSALRAFSTFRRRRGERLADDPWEAPLPTARTLNTYITYLSHVSRPWRDTSVRALRLYFIHHGRPDIAATIHAPLARRDHVDQDV